MSFTPKQKKMMIGVLVLAYIYFFYSYNWNDAIPGISQNREALAEASEELEDLEEQLANIEVTRSELESMKVADERYKDFVNEKIDVQSAIDYMDTLIHVLGNSVSGVNISSPRMQTRVDPNYYETRMGFNSSLKYDELMDFIEFIEGGNKSVRITELRVLPEPFSSEQREALGIRNPSIYRDDWDLNVTIGLTMYSLDEESSETFYEVSRNKLERFGYFDGISFIIPDELFPASDLTTIVGGGSQEPPSTRLTERRNILISMGSALAGTGNFSVNGLRPDSGELIRYRTRDAQNIVLRVDSNLYHVEVRDGNQGVQSFSGPVTGSDLDLHIREVAPDIPENVNLAINLTIINESNYNIMVHQNRDSGRVRIYDRNNSLVVSRSQTDKIFMR